MLVYITMSHAPGDSDEELDKYIPTIIIKPTEGYKKTDQLKFKGGNI